MATLKSEPPGDLPVFRYRTPPLSGNLTNGLGERKKRRPRLVFHWSPGRTPHPYMALDLHFTMVSGLGGPLLGWGSFLQRMRNMWQLRRGNGPVAAKQRPVDDPATMAAEIKALVRERAGDCIVGIAKITEDAKLEGEEVLWTYAICIGMPMDRDIMVHAPEPKAGTEVMRRYRIVAKVAIEVAEAIRAMGWI